MPDQLLPFIERIQEVINTTPGIGEKEALLQALLGLSSTDRIILGAAGRSGYAHFATAFSLPQSQPGLLLKVVPAKDGQLILPDLSGFNPENTVRFWDAYFLPILSCGGTVISQTGQI